MAKLSGIDLKTEQHTEKHTKTHKNTEKHTNNINIFFRACSHD